jgi:hypothetical protein
LHSQVAVQIMPTQRTKDVSLESCRGKMARTQLPSSCSCVKGAQLRHGCNRVSRNTFATGGIYTPPQFPSAFSRSPGPASRPQTCCPFRTHTQELVLQKIPSLQGSSQIRVEGSHMCVMTVWLALVAPPPRMGVRCRRCRCCTNGLVDSAGAWNSGFKR